MEVKPVFDPSGHIGRERTNLLRVCLGVTWISGKSKVLIVNTLPTNKHPATYKVIKLSAKWDSIVLEFVYGLLLGGCGYQGDIYEPVVNFFTSGNFSFSFVSTSLAYITIPKNKRKTKSTWHKKLTTTYTYSTHVQGHTWSQTLLSQGITI